MLNCPNTELFQMKPHINKEDTGTESYRQEYRISQSQDTVGVKIQLSYWHVTYHFLPHTHPQNQQQNTNLCEIQSHEGLCYTFC